MSPAVVSREERLLERLSTAEPQLRARVERAELLQIRRILEGPVDPPRAGRGRGELVTERARLLDHQVYRDLLDRLDGVLESLEKNQTAPAQERMALLLSVLRTNKDFSAYAADMERYRTRCETLTKTTAQSLMASLKLPSSHEPYLIHAITVGPPYAAPDDQPALAQKQEALQGEWQRLLPRLGRVLNAAPGDAVDPVLVRDWNTYQAAVAAYEEACMRAGRTRFIEDVGLPKDMNEEELQGFLSALSLPLPAPSQARQVPNRTNQGVINLHQSLEADRAELQRKMPLLFRGTFPRSVKDEYVQRIVEFLLRRDIYERKILELETPSSKWLLYTGAVANELAEEGLENLLGFANRPSYLKFDLLKDLPVAARTKLIQGWDQVGRTFAARGIPFSRADQGIRFLGRMSQKSGAFVTKLLEVESPVTVLLWGVYLSESDNKFKASLQFGSYIALSNASNALIGIADQTLARMGLALKVPGHPAAKFAALMAVAFLASDQIDQFTTWIDKQFPDCPGKHATGVGLSMISGEPIVTVAGEAGEALGVKRINPDRDQMEFLGREEVAFTRDTVVNRVYFQNIDRWNARVDQAVASQQNPVLKELWSLQKISDPQRWAKRMSVDLFSRVGAAKATEDGLAKELISRKIIGARSDLNACEIATADTGESRNDRELSYALGTGRGASGLQKARVFFESASVPQNDPLRIQWNEYMQVTQKIAKDVSVFRHLGLYRKDQWIVPSQGATLPVFVQEGLVEEIAHRNERRRRTSLQQYPSLNDAERARFSGHLAAAVRVEDQLSFTAGMLQFLSQVRAEYAKGISLNPSSVAGYESQTPERAELLDTVNAAYEVAKALPRDQAEKLLEPLRQLLLSGRTATVEQLRVIRSDLMKGLATYRAGAEEVREDQALRRRYELPDDTLFRVQGALTGAVVLSSGQEVNPTVSFRSLVTRARDQAFSHIMLMQGHAGASGGYHNLVAFNCSGTDPKQWKVLTAGQQFYHYKMRNPYGTNLVPGFNISYVPEQQIPFEDWVKANPDLALKLQPQFQKFQQKEVAQDREKSRLEEQYADREKRVREERRAAYLTEHLKDADALTVTVKRTVRDTRTGRDTEISVPVGTIGELMKQLEDQEKALRDMRPKNDDEVRALRTLQEQLPLVRRRLEGLQAEARKTIEARADTHAEQYAARIRAIPDAIRNDRNFTFIPKEPGSADGIHVMRYRSGPYDGVLVCRPKPYRTAQDSTEKNRFSAKAHDPAGDIHGFEVRLYPLGTDFATLDWDRDAQKATKMWGAPTSNLGDEGEDRKLLQKTLTTPFAQDSGGSHSLWRVLNLFAYSVDGGWGTTSDYNYKHRLHGSISALWSYVGDEQKFLTRLYDELRTSVGREGSINQKVIEGIKNSMYGSFTSWGLSTRPSGMPLNIREKIVEVFRY